MKKFFFTLFALSIFNINSHEFNPAHLVVNQLKDNQYIYEATWMYPFKNIGLRGEIIFPDECVTESSDLYYQGKYINEQIILECSTSLKGLSIEVKNLSVLTDALITINFIEDTFEGLVNVQKNIIDIPTENQYYPSSYLNLGISHLFDGLDHILFIFGLLFCITGFINILKTITAFTIAHSINLGLTVFDIISLARLSEVRGPVEIKIISSLLKQDKSLISSLFIVIKLWFKIFSLTREENLFLSTANAPPAGILD